MLVAGPAISIALPILLGLFLLGLPLLLWLFLLGSRVGKETIRVVRE